MKFFNLLLYLFSLITIFPTHASIEDCSFLIEKISGNDIKASLPENLTVAWAIGPSGKADIISKQISAQEPKNPTKFLHKHGISTQSWSFKNIFKRKQVQRGQGLGGLNKADTKEVEEQLSDLSFSQALKHLENEYKVGSIWEQLKVTLKKQEKAEVPEGLIKKADIEILKHLDDELPTPPRREDFTDEEAFKSAEVLYLHRKEKIEAALNLAQAKLDTLTDNARVLRRFAHPAETEISSALDNFYKLNMKELNQIGNSTKEGESLYIVEPYLVSDFNTKPRVTYVVREFDRKPVSIMHFPNTGLINFQKNYKSYLEDYLMMAKIKQVLDNTRDNLHFDSHVNKALLDPKNSTINLFKTVQESFSKEFQYSLIHPKKKSILSTLKDFQVRKKLWPIRKIAFATLGVSTVIFVFYKDAEEYYNYLSPPILDLLEKSKQPKSLDEKEWTQYCKQQKSIKDISNCLDAYFEKLSQHLKTSIAAELEKYKLQNEYLKLTPEQQKDALNKRHNELISQNTLEVIKKVESMSAILDINAPTEKQALVTRFEKTKIDHFNKIARRSAFENSPFKSELETISKNLDIEIMAFQIKAKNNSIKTKNSDITLELSTLRSHLKNLIEIDESLNSLKAKLPKMLMESPEIVQLDDKIAQEITVSGNKVLELTEKIINDKKP